MHTWRSLTCCPNIQTQQHQSAGKLSCPDMGDFSYSVLLIVLIFISSLAQRAHSPKRQNKNVRKINTAGQQEDSNWIQKGAESSPLFPNCDSAASGPQPIKEESLTLWLIKFNFKKVSNAKLCISCSKLIYVFLRYLGTCMQCGISSLLYQVFQQGSLQRVGPQEHSTVHVIIHRLAQPPVHIWGLAKCNVKEMENLRNIWKSVSTDALWPRFLPSNSFYSVFNLWSHSYIQTCPLSSATPTPRSWIVAGALPPFLADFSWAFFPYTYSGSEAAMSSVCLHIPPDRWLASRIRSAPVSGRPNNQWECSLQSGPGLKISMTFYHIHISSIVFLFFSAWLMLMC